MASRHYRNNLRNKKVDTRSCAIVVTTVLSSSGRLRVGQIQTDIFDIINAITLQKEIDKIVTMATELYKTIKTKVDLLNLIQRIEEVVISIITNVAGRVGLDIVLRRIQYLKELVGQLEPTCCIKFDGPYTNMVLEIITMLADAVDISKVHTSMFGVYENIHGAVLNEEYICQAQQILLSIFQNLADRVSLDIIQRRIVYLQEVVAKINTNCLFYEAALSQEVIDIITMISKIGSNGDIVTELDKITVFAQSLYNKLYKRVECINVVKDSETLILSIIGNFVDRVNLDIIVRRLTYLQEKIAVVLNS